MLQTLQAATTSTGQSRGPAVTILRTDTLLLLLLAGDILFIGMHLLKLWTPYFRDPMFSVTTERGFAETYQYLKFYWAAVLLLVLAISRRAVLFAAWSSLFAYLVVDDMFMVHERMGARLAARLPLPSTLPLRPQDVGEGLYLAGLGGAFITVAAILHWLSDARTRRESMQLLRLLFYLALFGVGLDLIHALTPREGFWRTAAAAVEDSGELVLMSVVVAYAARRLRAT
ncbi:MAG TPA: hypothetical protein VGD94_01755 [Vicinamibacterales bacterium]